MPYQQSIETHEPLLGTDREVLHHGVFYIRRHDGEGLKLLMPIIAGY